jgi:hypothetical protein
MARPSTTSPEISPTIAASPLLCATARFQVRWSTAVNLTISGSVASPRDAFSTNGYVT